MDILVTYVHDICRFKHYMKLKFNVNAVTHMAKYINEGYHVKLTDLPECDVRYLQASIGGINKPQICELKIVS